LIKTEAVLVNLAPSKPAYKLEAGDTVRVELPPVLDEVEMIPRALPLAFLYQDEDLAVIHKPAGLVVHPGRGEEDETLAHALLAEFDDLPMLESDPLRPGIVHRLDKDTSGVIVVALNEASQKHLMEQFKARTIEKHYLALTEAHPPNDKGRIEAPIGRDPNQRKKMTVLREGKEAITEFFVKHYYETHALLDVHLLTGRTHQIRVHLAFIGCPVVGDKVYGYRKQHLPLKRLFLHAYQISFDHPRTGERLTIQAPLPPELQAILDNLV
jgi:23S rRNA pseudouridine1911/1915/1917 synthase